MHRLLIFTFAFLLFTLPQSLFLYKCIIMIDNNTDSSKAVGRWILLGIGMLVIQVLLGGITRLTGSGLSMTEWKPIMGAIPPTNEQEWNYYFMQYQKIAQYKYINSHFTLSDFKFIFFWEWFHRLWARLIAIVFVIPFISFLLRGYIRKWMVSPLIILFALGGLQGIIGWVMVKSGLNDENIYVNHIKLAIHFVSAMVLIGYALLFALKMFIPRTDKLSNESFRKWAVILSVATTLQLFYGAFLAGMKAAAAAPTWPLINGMIVPDAIFHKGIINGLFFNPLGIHFIHRTLAYIIAAGIIIWWVKARKLVTRSLAVKRIIDLPFTLVIIQVLLGICSIMLSPRIVIGSFGVFEWFALLHQLNGMLLILSLTATCYIMGTRK